MHFYYLLIAFLIELVGTLFDTYVFISIIASIPLLVDYWFRGSRPFVVSA